MALRPRNTWHRTNGKWTCSLGHRGLRVRLFQKRSDGPFYRAVWIPGGGRDQKPLQTADREEAERLGKQLLAELLVQTERERPKTATDTPVRIADLWHRYSHECDEFLANTPETRSEKATRAGRFLEFFGADFDVRTMSPADWSRFVRARKSGRFTTRKRHSPGGVVTIYVDLTLLRTMCAWARTVRTSDNKRWLADDPLAGVKSERQKNPKRPVTSWDRYTRTREAARAIQDTADTAAARARWLKLEYLLVVAEATGKRIGSIIQLTWEDVDFQTGVIRWRAEADKKGYDWEIPTSPDLRRDLAVYRETSGRSSGLLFPSERRPNLPVQRRVIDDWLLIAEREAGLPKLTYGRWHPYRRKWATERKHLPLKDVAAAGGWRDASTLLKCYQQPDRETLLAVVTAPNKLRDAAIAPPKVRTGS